MGVKKLYLIGRGSEDGDVDYCFIEDIDEDFCSKYKWFFNTKTEYVFRMKDNKTIYLHRDIAMRKYPDSDDWSINGEVKTVDHKNRNRLDNTRDNIRLLTRCEQQANRKRPKNNKSGHVGVSFEEVRKKWKAEISIKYKNINLGRYDDIKHAIKARRLAEYIKRMMKDEDIDDMRDKIRRYATKYNECEEEKRKDKYEELRARIKKQYA